MSEHISQREAQSLERRVENTAERSRQQKFLLTEVMAGFGAGWVRGYMLVKNPTLAGFGPGGKLHIDHVVALGGLFMGRKKSRMGAIGRGAGIMALGHIGSDLGMKNATGA